MKIKDLLRMNIEEEVPLVIKAGEQDLEVEGKEIAQYIVTHQVERHLEDFLENYNLPSTGKVGVWISGFFGSGKSYFAKMLGYLLSNHTLPRGISARDLFKERLGTCSNPEFLKGRVESLHRFPATVVVFEIIAEGVNDETVQQVMFKMLLQASGYSSLPNVAIMEHELDSFGKLDPVRQAIAEQGGDYAKIAQNAGEFRRFTTRVMRDKLDYQKDEAEAFLKSAVEKYQNLTPTAFADLCIEYTQKSNKRLVFIIDEIGQYATSLKDSDDRILQLQAVAETLAAKGKGAVRFIVTAQEKLDQLIANSNFDKRKLGKLTDRFEIRLDLTSENVDEVARERLLKKKVDSEGLFRDTFEKNQGNITTLSNTEGSYHKIESCDQFMPYYPFFPYHFKLLPDLVQTNRGTSGQQATARKFIFLVDSILKKLKEEEFGRIVNAPDLFDALGTSFFGSETVALVNSATEYRGKTLQAPDILKALQLLKNLAKIKTTQAVLTRMLCNSLFQKQYELTEEVKEALDYLEKAKYITRYNGEITLVTDMEREFISERENSVVDLPQVRKQIVEQLQGIFQYKQLQYRDGPWVGVEWFYDGSPMGGKDGGIQAKVCSFLGGKDIESLEVESLDHPETVYLVPENNDSVDTLARDIKKLEAALNTFRTKKTGGDIHEILSKYAKMAEEKKEHLKAEMARSLDNGVLLYSGETLPPGKASEQLKTLLREKVIPAHFPEITFTTATSKDIENALTLPQTKLKNLKVDEDHRVFDENGELLETHKIISPVIQFLDQSRSGADILETFGSSPYGWTPETILFSVACLQRAGKATVNGKDSPTHPEVNRALKSPSAFRSAVIRKSVVLSTPDRNKLLQLLNPLLEDGKLTLQSPRSEFISRAAEAIKHLDRTLHEQKEKMETLGATVNWKLETTRKLLNTLTGASDDCLDQLLQQAEEVRQLHEEAQRVGEFLEKNYERIRQQKTFLGEVDGEIDKEAFEPEQRDTLRELLKEYRDTLPHLSTFGSDLDGCFEKLRNTYKGYFQALHAKRDELRKMHNAYLDSIGEEVNKAGNKVREQSWFRKVSPPCDALQLRFSTSCDNCHSGFREAKLDIADLEKKHEELQAQYQAFLQQQPEPDPGEAIVPPEAPPKTLRLTRTLSVLQLKNMLAALSLPDEAQIQIELED
ncbi:MAG TPA: BREX system P-loop protein BrxC [Thermotogota bacterium]|nr:BREX system P-loop protein BrxC [Thermotogota bacterium]